MWLAAAAPCITYAYLYTVNVVGVPSVCTWPLHEGNSVTPITHMPHPFADGVVTSFMYYLVPTCVHAPAIPACPGHCLTLNFSGVTCSMVSHTPSMRDCLACPPDAHVQRHVPTLLVRVWRRLAALYLPGIPPHARAVVGLANVGRPPGATGNPLLLLYSTCLSERVTDICAVLLPTQLLDAYIGTRCRPLASSLCVPCPVARALAGAHTYEGRYGRCPFTSRWNYLCYWCFAKSVGASGDSL